VSRRGVTLSFIVSCLALAGCGRDGIGRPDGGGGRGGAGAAGGGRGGGAAGSVGGSALAGAGGAAGTSGPGGWREAPAAGAAAAAKRACRAAAGAAVPAARLAAAGWPAARAGLAEAPAAAAAARACRAAAGWSAARAGLAPAGPGLRACLASPGRQARAGSQVRAGVAGQQARATAAMRASSAVPETVVVREAAAFPMNASSRTTASRSGRPVRRAAPANPDRAEDAGGSGSRVVAGSARLQAHSASSNRGAPSALRAVGPASPAVRGNLDFPPSAWHPGLAAAPAIHARPAAAKDSPAVTASTIARPARRAGPIAPANVAAAWANSAAAGSAALAPRAISAADAARLAAGSARSAVPGKRAMRRRVSAIRTSPRIPGDSPPCVAPAAVQLSPAVMDAPVALRLRARGPTSALALEAAT